MIKAVLFDIDDTLCMTEAVCFGMENVILQIMGRPTMTRAQHRANWGTTLAKAITERSPGIDVDAFYAIYEPTLKRYIAEGRLDTIPEENFKALEALRKKGFELGAVTSRTHTELAHLLEPHHRLSKYLTKNAFYYADNMSYHKPDPRAFEALERDHGWLPEECIYVGDTIGDAQAATGAGLLFVACLQSGIKSKADFADYPVHGFIQSFPDIIQIIHDLQ